MNNKPIDMKELINKLESINEGDLAHEGNDKNVVHASSTRALAEDIVAHAKSIADQHGIDITNDKGYQIWEGIMRRQLSDAVRGLQDYVLERRIDIEYLAGQDGRARAMQDESITEGPEDKASFSQFVIDFDGQVDDMLQAGWAEAEDEYGEDGVLSPEFESALERMVSSYCKQCNV